MMNHNRSNFLAFSFTLPVRLQIPIQKLLPEVRRVTNSGHAGNILDSLYVGFDRGSRPADVRTYYVFFSGVLLCMPKFSRVFLCAATRAPNFSRFEKYTSALLQADNFSKVSGTIITKQVIRKDQTHT